MRHFKTNTTGRSLRISILALAVCALTVWAQTTLDPLELVEKDQTGVTRSSDDIFNRNIVLNSYGHFTDVSSYKPGSFGFKAHDGNARSAWVLHPDKSEAVLELSWGQAVPIDEVRVMEHRADNVENFKLELYNGKSWETIEPVDAAKRSLYRFPLRPASALRISIQTNGNQAGVAEVEVFNTQSDQPLPRYGSKELIEAMRASGAVILFDGSPYLFSRKGRELIREKYAETSLTNLWTEPVLESVVTHLGGTVEQAEGGPLQVSLNGQSFALEGGSDALVIGQLETLAAQAGLEFIQRASLVMIGKGLEALDRENIRAELATKLGQNPYWVSGRSDGEPDARVTPTLSQEGITYEWAGFRATDIPHTGSDAWLKYAETKSVRTWRNAPAHMSKYIRPQERLETEADFERYRGLIRNPPHGDRFKQAHSDDVVALPAFMNKYHESISAEFSTYQALGIDVINATGPKNWPDTYHDDFINWASTYMMTYYLAKHFGVTAHQFGNEPDWYFDQISDEQVLRRLTLIADAVHSAIEDVNRDHGRELKAIFSAPVLAGNFYGRNARIMMRNLYTNYDGSKSEQKRFNLFNRHRYSGRPYQNALEVRAAKEMMLEEAGETIPQVFTELNFSTGRYWRRPKTTFTNDTPEVYSTMANIWGLMMREQGVYGIFVFKMNDPGTWFWKDIGRFSNTITYSMNREMDPGLEPEGREQIAYGTKNFEVCRLFSKGFHGSRPLLRTDVQCSDSKYLALTAEDKAQGRFYIWSVQNDNFKDFEVEFDLSHLNVPAGALITVETVSGARHGEITERIALPDDQKLRITQAPQSAALLTIHLNSLAGQIVYAQADATVVQGVHSKRNFGDQTLLGVSRHSNADKNQISLLRFELPEGTSPVERAVLELHGKSESTHAYDGGFLYRVYAVKDSEWEEGALTAENAPYIYQTVSSLKEVNLEQYPVGHATCFNTPSTMMVDLTLAVKDARAAGRATINLVLIREVYWPGENTDDVSARFASRQAAAPIAPKIHIYSNLAEAGK